MTEIDPSIPTLQAEASPGLPGWLLPLVLAAAATIYLLLRTAPAPPEEPAPMFPPPTPIAALLLGDLEPGATVADFTVDGIEGPGAQDQDDAAILVHLHRGDMRLAITIAPHGALEHNPPAQTAAHDLFFGHLQPDDAVLAPETSTALLDAFHARVSANE